MFFFLFSDFDAQKKDLPCGRSNSIPIDWKLTEVTSEFYWTLCIAVDYFKNWQKSPKIQIQNLGEINNN